MNEEQKVAVVTGANKGIGLEICRQLARKGILVVLTARDEQRGWRACEMMKKQELPVRFCKLDVNHASDIVRLGRFLQAEFDGRCDILVNNAGIFLDRNEPYDGGESFNPFGETTVDTLRQTMETNVYGPFLLCQEIVPLMKKNNYGRIINMSSGLGQLSTMGAGYTAYRMSKAALNVLTRVLSQELSGYNIQVNSVNPGWVKTDMGGANAPRDVAQGADTVVWLATAGDDGPRGGFFKDREPIEW